jgi:Xaa-Pro aminopeptidase
MNTTNGQSDALRANLPPLPDSYACTAGARRDCWTEDQMRAYALQAVQAALASSPAEAPATERPYCTICGFTVDTSVPHRRPTERGIPDGR